jgi:hypothetical protein
MTSAGANTWSVPLEINNLESRINSGVSSIATSGAGLSASGATGAVTLTNTGVTSLVAGTNVTISGSTGAVTINSNTNPTVIDLAGVPTTYTLTPAQLNNSLITSSVAYTPLQIITFTLPTYAQLIAVYPNTTYLVCRFVNVGKPYALQFAGTGYFSSNVNGSAGSSLIVPSPSTTPSVLAGSFYWTLNTTIDRTQGQVQYFFEYAGQYT